MDVIGGNAKFHLVILVPHAIGGKRILGGTAGAFGELMIAQVN